MVDSTLIYEMNPVTPPENAENQNPKPKGRGRPKKYKTPEEIEDDKNKHREYYRNYYKERSARDPEFAEKYRTQLNIRTKRYAEKNKERLKKERDEMVLKSKLYDEIMLNLLY